jgi:hypothetical protein
MTTSTYPARPPGAPVHVNPPRDWSAGRVTALVIGVITLMGSLILAFGGLTLALADNGLRDDDGFLMSGDTTFSTATYAMVSESIDIEGDAEMVPQALLGDAKVTAYANGDAPVFVGVALTADVDRYLDGVGHATVVGFQNDDPVYRTTDGVSPTEPPTASDIWETQSSGTGEQSVTWPVENGDWTVVVMNADGSRGVSADVSAGATVPALGWLVAVTLTLAGIGLLIAFVLMFAALRSPSRR